jgi:hypothetical protein
LGDTIDFGDGRQYKVQMEEEIEQGTPGGNEPYEEPTDKVVSKEERFVEDTDRSWPKGPGQWNRRVPEDRPASSASGSTRVSAPMHSPDKAQHRALFNERSNRLEPWDSASQQHEKTAWRGAEKGQIDYLGLYVISHLSKPKSHPERPPDRRSTAMRRRPLSPLLLVVVKDRQQKATRRNPHRPRTMSHHVQGRQHSPQRCLLHQ